MKIGVDTASLGATKPEEKAGNYFFARGIIQALSDLDTRNQYLLYSFNPIEDNFLDKLGGNFKNIVLHPSRGYLRFRLPLDLTLQKPDIFIGLNQALPPIHPKKSIAYFHDLAFEKYPQFYRDSYDRLSEQSRFAAEKACRIIAVSNSTKKDITEIYGIPGEKISVIYHGKDGIFHRQKKNTHKILEKYKINIPFLLYVGSLKPVKNIRRIIRAFYLFSKNHPDYSLVLAGADMGEGMEINKEKINHINYVERKDLSYIYSAAQIFIAPSLYEGFGLPILEAMSCGLPVITSRISALPEVVGDAGLLVDPENEESINKAIELLAGNNKLREDISKKALNQAKKFSWSISAKRLLKEIIQL